MKMPTISKILSLLPRPVSELVGYRRTTAKPVSRTVEVAEETASKILRREFRRQRASQWQGLARQAVLSGDEVRCSARTESCQDFNGDFYGLREQRSGKYAFFLGDVSGKGLPAAFYQTSCLTLLRQAARRCANPVEVVDEVNTVLSERQDEQRFATLVYGVFDTANSTLTLVSAGHPLPFLFSANGELREVDCPQGLPVGLFSDFRYRSKVVKVRPGDTLVIYSDGLSEARNSDREFLGELGLLGLLVRFSHLTLAEMTGRVMREVEKFAPHRADDQTIIALRFGTPEAETRSKVLACA